MRIWSALIVGGSAAAALLVGAAPGGVHRHEAQDQRQAQVIDVARSGGFSIPGF